MDRRVNLQKLRSESSESSEHLATCNTSVNNTSVPSSSEHHKSSSYQSETSSPPYNETFKIRLNTSGGITTVKQEVEPPKHEVKVSFLLIISSIIITF